MIAPGYKPIDHEAILASLEAVKTYWDNQPTDNPNSINGFNGTFDFSDHDLVPGAIRDFIFESFPKIDRFRRIPLENINELMNEVWEGPGSMPKIQKLYNDMRIERWGKNDVGVKTRTPNEQYATLPNPEDEEE
jgi:hypothetical protein